MKNSIKIFGILGLFALLLVSAGIGFAEDTEAGETDSTAKWQSNEPRMQMQKIDSEVREQLQAAVEAGDYETWSQIREENSLADKRFITEENFGRFAEMHAAMKSGDFETAKQTREELGLRKGFGKGMGNKFQNRFENKEEFCNRHCACGGA